jgi:ribosome-binding protein aMBF1 (putative translation factor)
MADRAPSSYAELVSVLDSLPVLVRERRRRLGLSLRSAATAIGTDASTLIRFETGKGTAFPLVRRLLLWVGEPDPAPAWVAAPESGAAT